METLPLSKQWTPVREEWILSQWLLSILVENIGRARNQTSDLQFSSLQRHQLSYGAQFYSFENVDKDQSLPFLKSV